jgi:hypothetical protein
VTKQQEILSARLANIDRRRAELEIVLSTLPPDAHSCCGCPRQELEEELNALWRYRLEIAEQLNLAPHWQRAHEIWLRSRLGP